MTTIKAASAIDELQSYANTLGAKLKLTEKVLGHLMPHAMKGDYERYLADASIFMEFFSLNNNELDMVRSRSSCNKSC